METHIKNNRNIEDKDFDALREETKIPRPTIWEEYDGYE